LEVGSWVARNGAVLHTRHTTILGVRIILMIILASILRSVHGWESMHLRVRSSIGWYHLLRRVLVTITIRAMIECRWMYIGVLEGIIVGSDICWAWV
jgi:hypothetical protein